jgi:pilus assembly protein CpaF
MRELIESGVNLLISGGTGSGKTTLLNALTGFIDARDRVVTIEETAELRLARDHVVRLEARPANAEGSGAVSVRDLVRAALRMRPDRLVIGEVRGAEALDLLQALNTGHDGSLSTVHANSPVDALRRLSTLALFGNAGLPHRAVCEQLRSAVDIVVQVGRTAVGAREVVSVVEVGVDGDDDFTVRPLLLRNEGELRVCGEPNRPHRRRVAV